MFKNMREVPLTDVAVSLQFYSYLDEARRQKYLAKLQDLISMTNPKLIVLPSAMALITIMSVFN